MRGIRKWALWVSVAISFTTPIASAQNTEKTGTVWAVIVGVSKVRIESALAPLKFADDDAKLFYHLLQDFLGARVPRDQIFLHLSETSSDIPQLMRINDTPTIVYPATRDYILSNLRRVVAQAQPGDRVIFYFSGHGLIGYREDESEESLFLATTDWQTLSTGKPTKFRVVPNTGLKVSEITDAFADWHVGKQSPDESPGFLDVWIFLDTCYAGAASSEKQLQLLARLDEQLREQDEAETNLRGVMRVPQENNAQPAPVRPRFIWILSSSRLQLSWEDEEHRQGVFTYYLARAMRGAAWGASPYRNIPRGGDQLITADLGAYLRMNVNQRTMIAKGVGQLPTALPEFDTIPVFSFTRAERRFGISVDVKTPNNERVTVMLRSRDEKRFLAAEAPCLFTLAQIDAELGADDAYIVEVRVAQRRPLLIEIPVSITAPTSVKVDYTLRNTLPFTVKQGDILLEGWALDEEGIFRRKQK